MAIGAALTDKARAISTAKTGTRTEGGYQKGTVYGPWFRCRYDPGSESESKSEASVHRRRSATILVGRRDTSGKPTAIKAGAQLEVQWTAGGQTLTLMVQGAPEPIVKRRTIIGYTVNLVKVGRNAG